MIVRQMLIAIKLSLLANEEESDWWLYSLTWITIRIKILNVVVVEC